MKFKPQEQYVYAVTRIHANENHLLGTQDLEQLITTQNLAAAMRYLSDKGWGSTETTSPDALIAYENERTWSLIDELIGSDAPFDVFRLANDYHNLKAAVKLVWMHNEKDYERCCVKHGTVSADLILKAAAEQNFSLLPEALALAGRKAFETLTHTQSGQMTDVIIDTAALCAIDAAGKNSGSELLSGYATLTVDVANIKSAVRCCQMNKGSEFAEQVIARAGSLNTGNLISAATSGMEAVYACLRGTSYDAAADALRQSMASFERWCDNRLIAFIKPQRMNYFTIEPIAAFVLGRENEIKIARLILSAKQNDISIEVLRERLRDTYV